MEHLFFNCHGEATLLMQGLATVPFLGAFFAPYVRFLLPVRVSAHKHDVQDS